MIITIQGYNGKKNRSTLATACLAGMTSLSRGLKTLVIQLIDNDISSVESMLVTSNINSEYTEGNTSMAEECIDNLINSVSSTKLTEEDFNTNCTPVLKNKHLLDITAISKNKNFTGVIVERMNEIKRIIESAEDFYDNIYILLPTNVTSENVEAIKELNELADKSIYCLLQGRKLKQDALFGKEIYYLVMDFEPESQFSTRSIKKHFCENKQKIYKFNRSVQCNDAAMQGELLEFIRKNRKNDESDANYDWSMDLKRIIRNLLGDVDGNEEEKEWETIAGQSVFTNGELNGYILKPSPCKEVKKGIFGRKTLVPSHEIEVLSEDEAEQQAELTEENIEDLEEDAKKRDMFDNAEELTEDISDKELEENVSETSAESEEAVDMEDLSGNNNEENENNEISEETEDVECEATEDGSEINNSEDTISENESEQDKEESIETTESKKLDNAEGLYVIETQKIFKDQNNRIIKKVTIEEYTNNYQGKE